jgi:ABC-type uncharacterized transport system auxiliary subunit
MRGLRYKSAVVLLLLCSLFLTGCQKKTQHLSDLFDLKKDKFADSNMLSPSIVQNDQLCLYDRKQELVRINKKTIKELQY